MLPGVNRSARQHADRLVALAFIGQPPGKIGIRRGEYTVNHKDFDKLNNQSDNLEWLTCGDNYIHAYSQGRVEVRSGVEIGNSKLNPESVQVIRQRLDAGESPKLIALDYGVVKSTIYAIKKGITWD